jgi:hypothetical protein
LRTIVKAELERRWRQANKAALAAYSHRVSSHGLLSDEAERLTRGQ